MKRILIAAALAVQIITACGQGNNAGKSAGVANEQKVDKTVDHDSAWYSNRMAELGKIEEKLVKEYRSLASAPMSAERDAKIEQIYAKADSLGNIEKTLTLEIVKKFKATKFPARFMAGDMAYAFSYDELKEICDPKSGFYNEPEMKTAKYLYSSLEKRHPGLQYKDLVMPDMTGKTVKLSDYVGKGKYVLVDFWASWCGPCRQEMPNVVKAYNKYRGKNFEIVGVSFDDSKGSWTAAVKQLGMAWPQMSDLKGWHSAAATTYGINSIPANILVDPKGKIIAIDLRGEELQSKLAEVLK